MKPPRWAAPLALILAALIYVPRLGAPLMWDDRPFLLDDAALDRPLPLASYVTPAYFPLTGELTWRPLATFSYSTGVRVFGKRPVPLRLTMLALHVLNAALLAWLVASSGLGAGVGVAAASLFLIHPVHVETLMTVTFNKEILSTLGVLLMLLAHQRRRPALAACGLAFAVLPKETGIVGLALAPLYDLLTGGAQELRRRWKDHALYAATASVYLYVRFGPMKGPGGEANLSAALPWSERLFYAAKGFASSIRVLIFPWRLRIDYFALPASSLIEYVFWILAAAAIIALIVVLAHHAFKTRNPALAFFLLWPLPVLFLTSNIFPTGVLSLRLMAERWLYLPAAGLAAALAFALRKRPRALMAVMLIWGALGAVRAADWSSEPRLWASLVRIYPWSSKAREGLGEALYRAGKVEEAESSFQGALAVRENRQDLVLAHYVPYAPAGTIGWDSASLERGLGLCRLSLGDEPGAEAFFEKSAELQPSDVFSTRVLAYLSARRGDDASARKWLDKGLALDPNDDFLKRLEPDVKRRRLSFRARFD